MPVFLFLLVFMSPCVHVNLFQDVEQRLRAQLQEDADTRYKIEAQRRQDAEVARAQLASDLALSQARVHELEPLEAQNAELKAEAAAEREKRWTAEGSLSTVRLCCVCL